MKGEHVKKTSFTAQQSISGHKTEILLVDDDRYVLETFTAILRNEGYEVTSVSSGKAALQELKKRWFDLVVTDLHMPEISGFMVLKAAKKLSKGIPVIMVTADHGYEFAFEALRLGADGYLLKPCRVENMRKCIMNALKKSGERVSTYTTVTGRALKESRSNK